jgi:hypothetical protein
VSVQAGEEKGEREGGRAEGEKEERRVYIAKREEGRIRGGK